MRVEEEYADVLQNIEFAVVTVLKGNPNVVDRDVLAAIDALIRTYSRQRTNAGAPTAGPPGRAGVLYKECRRMCEWRLGRAPLNEDQAGDDAPQPGELSVKELIRCLKRLRKSVRLWHGLGGRQEYLKYVQGFLSHLADQRGGHAV